MQNRNLTNLQKKTANCPEHLAQCLSNCNKIKLLKNIISLFSSKVSSVQSECRFNKSAAFFSQDVREVVTKLPKYLRKVTIRRRPLSAKVFTRQVKSNFVELEKNFDKSPKLSRWKPKVITKIVKTFKNYPPSRSYSGDVGFAFDNNFQKCRRRNEICRQGCENICSKSFWVVLKTLSFSSGVPVDN